MTYHETTITEAERKVRNYMSNQVSKNDALEWFEGVIQRHEDLVDSFPENSKFQNELKELRHLNDSIEID